MTRHTCCLALAVILVGCARQGTPEPTPAGPGAAPATKLEMRVWAEGEGKATPLVYTIMCDPPSGNHPDVDAACAALQKLGVKAFAPVSPDAMCTQQYGGPMEALVRGTVAGEPLEARLAYTDGCQIARWDRVAAVVPRPETTKSGTVIREE
jgi:hypothetical protein